MRLSAIWLPLLTVGAMAVLLLTSSPQAQAEICGEAISFNLYVTDSGGAAINDSNKADRSEVLTFAWAICPDAVVSDNFGNAHFGDYQFQRGVSDQPTGGFNWIVSSGGDTRTYWVPINDAPHPPPPPPPPPLAHVVIRTAGGTWATTGNTSIRILQSGSTFLNRSPAPGSTAATPSTRSGRPSPSCPDPTSTGRCSS